MTHRPVPGPGTHASHDQLLVAHFAAGDVTSDAERMDAERLVAECPACRALMTDLRSLTTALADLPAARRQRDFRLSDADARRLHGSAIDRLLERLAAPRLSFVQPLAGAAMALGLGLAVISGTGLGLPFGAAGVPAGSPGASAAAALEATDLPPEVGGPRQYETGGASGGATGAPAATDEVGPTRSAVDRAQPSPKATDSVSIAGEDAGTPEPERLRAVPEEDTPPASGLLAGIALAVGGALLLAVRLIARRRTDDPLLH